jgi:hypothetical protein
MVPFGEVYSKYLKMWPSASASIFIFVVQPRHHYWEYVEGHGRKIVWILLKVALIPPPLEID